MRILAVLPTILISFHTVAHAAEQARATTIYNGRSSAITGQTINSELSKHPERLSSLLTSYQVKQDVPATGDLNSAYYKYNLRVHKMLEDKVAPAFSTQTRRLEVDYEFNLDFHGRVTSLKNHAKTGGQWAEQTISRGIRALKFPPVPAQVFVDLKQEPPLRILGQ